METKWRLVTGIAIATVAGALLAPGCGPLCAGRWRIYGVLAGLAVGLVIDFSENRRR
jgi:hypothetical protein